MSKTNFKDFIGKHTNEKIKDTFDQLFEMEPDTEQKIVSLPCYKLIIDATQPFRLYSQAELESLAERIARSGLLNPIIVRTAKQDKYEILSGRNRARAVMLNGDKVIAAIIHDVDDEIAELIMLDSNLGQRQNLLPSEKAFAYQREVEILNRRGKRTDLTSSNGCTKSDSRETVATHNDESRATVSNYIRLTYLLSDLLQKVDDEEILFMVGVELSFLRVEQQQHILDEYINKNIKINRNQAGRLKKLSKEQEFTKDNIEAIFASEPKAPTVIKFSRKKFSDYQDIIDNTENLEELFLEFLHDYRQNHK